MFSYEFKGALTMPVHQGGGCITTERSRLTSKEKGQVKSIGQVQGLHKENLSKNNLWHSIMIGKKAMITYTKKIKQRNMYRNYYMVYP